MLYISNRAIGFSIDPLFDWFMFSKSEYVKYKNIKLTQLLRVFFFIQIFIIEKVHIKIIISSYKMELEKRKNRNYINITKIKNKKHKKII